MAKHQSTPKDQIIAHTKSFLGKWQAATTLHSRLPPSIPKRVARAHTKHHLPPAPTQLSLGDRFHALPPEIRAHIFSLILVQPIKWDLPHTPSCILLPENRNEENGPRPCALYRYTRNPAPGYMHPNRSKWAPEKRNEFMCSGCWDRGYRPGSHPPPFLALDAPCLCGRRAGLEVLMVCRKWYEEAGFVLYSRSTFTFGSCREFVAWIDALPEKWKGVVGRVSIILVGNEWTNTIGPVATLQQRLHSGHRQAIAETWSRIRQLTSLSYLELDAAFLTQLSTVKAMLRLGLRSTRQVRFVLSNPDNRPVVIRGSKWIYPNMRYPDLLVGGFPEEVARAIKGQRRFWMRREDALKRAVERHGELMSGPCRCLSIEGQVQTTTTSADIREYDCHDCEGWRRMWQETGGDSHPAFLGSGRYVDHGDVHWRSWRPMVSPTGA